MYLSKSKGKSKSKSKKMVNLGRNAIPKDPQRQSKRWKSSNSKKTIAIKYFDAKITFTFKNVEESLAELLKEVFTNLPELQNYSILALLRLPDKNYEEQIYNHQIDTKEAMALLYHLEGIRNGKVNEMQQIQELIKIIQTYQLDDNQIGNNLQREFYDQRMAFNNQVITCRKELKALFQNRVLEIQNLFLQSTDSFRLNILESKIEQLSMKLFDQTVIGLRQFQIQNKKVVQAIFEHTYPSKIYSKTFLMRRIGTDMYLKKKISFINTYAISQRQGLSNTNLIVCHICKKLVRKEYIRCAQKDTKIIDRTYLNSPYVYYKRMIAVDYRYDPKDAADLYQELDYFKYAYHPGQQPKKQCNRVYCIECTPKLRKVEAKNYLTDYKCDFCFQICSCESCLIAYELVKALSHFNAILVKNRQNKQPYQRVMNRVNFLEKKDPHFKTNIHCRTGFRETGNFDFKISYEQIMAKYQRLAQKLKEVQELTVASKEQLIDPSVVLTSELIEVKKMFEQLKKITQPQENIGKTLQNVMQLYNQIQQKRIQKQYIQNIQGKQRESLKDKFDQEPEAHNIYRKFSVTNHQPKEIPIEILSKYEADEITQQLLNNYPTIIEEEVGRVVHIKNEVAYTEEDYDRMMVVDRYKIYSQREKTYEQLKKKGILHQLQGGNFLNSFEDINDYFPKRYKNDQVEEEINFVVKSSESDQEVQRQKQEKPEIPSNPIHQSIEKGPIQLFQQQNSYNEGQRDEDSGSVIEEISNKEFSRWKKDSKP